MKRVFLSVFMQYVLLGVAYGNPINISNCSCTVNPLLDNTQMVVNYSNSADNLTNEIHHFGFYVVGNSVEVNDTQNGLDIDLKSQSIRINFNDPNGVTFAQGSFFKFFNINPSLPSSCNGDTVVVGTYVTTSDSSATWLSGNPSTAASLTHIHQSDNLHFSNVKIHSTPPGGQHTWAPGSWIEIDLTFSCVSAQIKKGMTWGFAGFSDIRYYNTQNCNWNTARLACETYPVNSPQSNHCNHSYSFPNSNPSAWETPITGPVTTNPPIGNGTRKCDPVNGDTVCTEKRHVLCIAKPNNPYFKRQHPYDGSPLTGYPSNINLIPFVRPRYEIHAVPVGGQPAEYSEGWVDQHVKLSRDEVSGVSLGSVADGDAACGAGWRMASFDDGKWVQGMGLNTAYGNLWSSAPKQSGGWAFHANLAPDDNKGSLTHHGDSGMNARWRFVNKRYWVNSTQGGNCWD